MKRTLKIAGIALATLAVAAVAVYIVSLLRMVTPKQAQQSSQKLFDDVKAKLGQVPGYTIVKAGQPSVRVVQDEIGSKDYILTADFLVQKSAAGSTESSAKADVADLAKRLPANSYGISVENTPQVDGRPMVMCVYASRYLNDDGTYILQKPAENAGKYIAQDEFDAGYTSNCADLLQQG